MAAAKKTKTSKSPLSAAKQLNKKQLGILVAALAVIGVGAFYWFKSHAAAVPPTAFTVKKSVQAKSPYISVQCMDTAIKTGYGHIVYNCIGQNGKSAFIGTYSPITNVFTAVGGAFNFYSGAGGCDNTGCYGTTRTVQNAFCKNMNNTFSGVGINQSAYGPIYYGYVYEWYGSWIAKPASYSPVTGNCSASGSWQPITVW